MAIRGQLQKDLLLGVRQMIPPLLPHFHKGQQGRVAVIGGCEDHKLIDLLREHSYTGAPYFSALASALLGCDMSHIICHPLAAPAIKSYSPNLMVHPYLGCPSSDGSPDSRINPLLSRLHTLVIGPGLGRDPAILSTVANVIIEAQKHGLDFVLDADALLVVQETPSLVRGYHGAVLTPNKAEFARLCAALKIETKTEPMEVGDEEEGEQCAQLARALGGVTVLQKGIQDWISNGSTTLRCTVKGGNKRSGGQGDTLSGCIGTFLAWKKAYLDNLWDHNESLTKEDLTLLSAFGASAVTRMCSRRAFQKKGRAMQASDLSTELPGVFKDLFECTEEDIEKQLLL